MEEKRFWKYRTFQEIIEDDDWNAFMEAFEEFVDTETYGISYMHEMYYRSECFEDCNLSLEEAVYIVENSYGETYHDWNDYTVLDSCNGELIGFNATFSDAFDMLTKIGYWKEFLEYIENRHEDYLVEEALDGKEVNFDN